MTPDPPTAPTLEADAEGWITARPPRAAEVVLRLLTLPRMIRDHRDLIGTSVRREIDGRFSGTALGWVWPLVHPLFLFAVYYFIFTELLDFKMPDVPEDKKAALGVYMFVGIMAWTALAETILRGTSSITDNGNLIKKLSFPAEILPLNIALASVVTHLFALVVFLVACLVTPIWPLPTAAVAWVPVIVLVQVLFAYGLALLLSTLHVFLRDTLQLVTIFVTVWMFVTPLFWAPQGMRSAEEWMPFIRANPVYHLVQAWRGALMGDVYVPPSEYTMGGFASQAAAVPAHLLVFACWAVLLYLVGYAFFVSAQRRFADEV